MSAIIVSDSEFEEGKYKLKILNKIAHKWGFHMYLENSAKQDVFKILKSTSTCASSVVGYIRTFDIKVLREINVNDVSVQKDWEIAREILCKISHGNDFYRRFIIELDIEIAGNRFKKYKTLTKFYFF